MPGDGSTPHHPSTARGRGATARVESAAVILVGLTGGIGAGKSTVSTGLVARGAVLVDADAVTRELQRAGQPMLAELAAHFGDDVLTAAGELDRATLAGLVFNDPERLKELNKLVHPPINREIARRTLAHRATDRVVLLDIPLLVEGGDRRYNTAANIVVDTPVDVAVERLVTHRGMSEADARARMARQVTREERLAKADRVIDNGGPTAALDAQLDELWRWMQTLTPATDDDLAPYEQRIAETDPLPADDVS